MKKSASKAKKFYHFTWLDIVAAEDVDREFVDKHSPTSLLAEKRNCTGYIYKEDDYAVVIVRDEDQQSMSYIVIPKACVIKKKRLYGTLTKKPSKVPRGKSKHKGKHKPKSRRKSTS